MADDQQFPRAGVLVALLAAGSATAGAETVPDPAEVRAHIDRLIAAAAAAHAPASLGLVHDAVSLAISYGAPAYNRGRIGACGDFYARTATDLTAAFPGAGPSATGASPAAATAFADLRAGLVRAAAAADDPDRKAWTMRCAFDLSTLEWTSEAGRGEGLEAIAAQWFRRGDYPEAGMAAEDAVAVLAEVRTEQPSDLPLSLRLAPLIQGQAQAELGEYGKAARAIAAGVALLPELLATKDVDLAALYGDNTHLAATVTKIEAAVGRRADDADLHFLLGFEYRFSGRTDDSAREIASALALDPHHAGALAMKPPEAAPADAPPANGGRPTPQPSPMERGNPAGDPDRF
jgi:tetratricopeptide (TPR) repeat protein